MPVRGVCVTRHDPGCQMVLGLIFAPLAGERLHLDDQRLVASETDVVEERFNGSTSGLRVVLCGTGMRMLTSRFGMFTVTVVESGR